jgi:hypothetical protein
LIEQDLKRLYEKEYSQLLERAHKLKKKEKKDVVAPPIKKTGKKVQDNNPLPPNFLKNYGFATTENFTYNINCLEDVGWVNRLLEKPLPGKSVEPDVLMYDKSRYEEDYIPRIVFIPNKKTMFTIMRHCIGVTEPE